MEAALDLFCRWCSCKFKCQASRYRHEDKFHEKEKAANPKRNFEPDSSLFQKCVICSIYTTRDKCDIQSHEKSEHHLRREHSNQSVTGSLSSVRTAPAMQPIQQLRLPHSAYGFLDTSYPRFIPQIGLAAATPASASVAAQAPQTLALKEKEAAATHVEALAAALEKPAAETAAYKEGVANEAQQAAASATVFSYFHEDTNYVFMPGNNISICFNNIFYFF